MSGEQAVEHQLALARGSVREAAGLLRHPTPSALQSAVPFLERAIENLRSIERGAGPAPDVGKTLDELRREVGQLTAMLRYAGAYHAGWARLLSGSAYTATGEAPAPVPAGRLVLEA